MSRDKKYEESIKMYEATTPQGKLMFQRATKAMPGGETRSLAYFNPYPLFIERTRGAYIYDIDGNKYIDFLNNYTSMIHGHAHPIIEKAIMEGVAKGTGVTAVLPEQIELAEILCDRIPGVERIRFCNSGTEAVMFAVRTARAAKGVDKIIKMEGGYHGTTDMMEFSISPPPPPQGKTYNPQCIPESAGISKKSGEDVIIAPYNDLDAVEGILKEQAHEIAGIIVEPVMGVAGFLQPNKGYLQGLRELADKYGVLLIFDEVQTFRLSTGGAQKLYGVTPDITALAKIIGGGLPVGAFGGKEELMSAFDMRKGKALGHSGTFNGNRAVMSGGIAAMKLYDSAAVNTLNAQTEKLAAGVRASISKYALPFSIAQVGSFMQIHFVENLPKNYSETLHPYKVIGNIFHLELLLRGIYIAPRGAWALSTVMSDIDIQKAIQCVDEALGEIAPLF